MQVEEGKMTPMELMSELLVSMEVRSAWSNLLPLLSSFLFHVKRR